MKNKGAHTTASMKWVVWTIFASALLFGYADRAFGQNATVATPQAKPSPAVIEPAVKELRGISLGMTADEVKSKLGKPLSQDSNGLFYTFSNTESAQFLLTSEGKVRTIATTYYAGDRDAPKIQDIFGPDIQVAASDDGRLYKMVRYPSAGFWLAYSKIGGDKEAMTTVTMKRIGDN
jgi:hypothetical protein